MSDNTVPKDYTEGYSPESRFFPYPEAPLLPPMADHVARFEAASQWVDLLLCAYEIPQHSLILDAWRSLQRLEAIELVKQQRKVIAAVRGHLESVVAYHDTPSAVNAEDMLLDERLAGAASQALAALDIIDGN